MRNNSVSICKAFGIMLMVMLHAGIPGGTIIAMYPTITPTEVWCVLYAFVGIFVPILFVKSRIMITKQFV